MVKKGMLLAIGMVVAGPLAACGGDDALTKAEYVSELSAMCRDFSARERVIGEPETAADLVEKGPRIVEAFEKAILDKVRAPGGAGRDRRSCQPLGRPRGPAARPARRVG